MIPGSAAAGTYEHASTFDVAAVQTAGSPFLWFDLLDVYNGGYEVRNFRFRLMPFGGLTGDINDDGLVDFADLLDLLANWGPCG